MPKISVLVVADSRGRLLKGPLDEVFHDIPHSLYWKKSLRLQETADYVAPMIVNMKPKLIYLLNGICDVTYISSREPWTVALQQRNTTATVDSYMVALDTAFSQIFSITNQLGYRPMILPVTQTGIDFTTYNNYPDDLVSPEQEILDLAINKINRNIVALHQSMHISPPILASAVHMRCRGKYRLARDKLTDGCHPTASLCLTWAHRLYKNALINLDSYDRYILVDQMYNQAD